jgi:hypothetical protein
MAAARTFRRARPDIFPDSGAAVGPRMRAAGVSGKIRALFPQIPVQEKP